jgi:hypothetical protein
VFIQDYISSIVVTEPPERTFFHRFRTYAPRAIENPCRTYLPIPPTAHICSLPQISSYLRRSVFSILLSKHLVVHLSVFAYQICVCRGREMEALNELIIGKNLKKRKKKENIPIPALSSMRHAVVAFSDEHLASNIPWNSQYDLVHACPFVLQ